MPDQPVTPRVEHHDFAGRYIRALKLPVSVGCLVAAGLAAYYFLYVRGETDYLIARNFRVLSTAAAEIDATITSSATVLAGFNTVTRVSEAQQSGLYPILAFANLPTDPKAPPRFRPRFMDAVSGWQIKQAPAATVPATGPDARTPQVVDVDVDVRLDGLLEKLLGGYVRDGLFDAVLVTSTKGRVLFQRGDPTLRLSKLEKAAVNASVEEIPLAGKTYKLFVQPCCQSIQSTLSAPATPEDSGWLVCALVSKNAIDTASLTVSFSVMALVAGAILLALFSWPFLKLSLSGPLQPLHLQDVVMVGLCALLGGALITVFVADIYAYSKLEADLDDALERLSRDVNARATQELQAMATQLKALDGELPRIDPLNLRGRADVDKVSVQPAIDISTYPVFESFAYIDGTGRQRLKMGPGPIDMAKQNVGDREYFSRWQRGTADMTPFVAQVRSRTTGSRQLIMSQPSKTTPATGTDRVPVVTLASPNFRSLLDATVVPGFAFAVVGPSGDVLFHSDRQHGAPENLFEETDNNRRLRSLVAARQGGRVSMKYWGEDYRAFVSQMTGAGVASWSLVAYYDQRLVRTVNAEWLVTTLFMTLIYASMYAGLALAIHLLLPGYRAPWLWPDPAKSRIYLHLVLFETILAVLWVVGLSYFTDSERVWIALVLPCVAWSAAYLALSRPAPGQVARTVVMAITLGLSALWILDAKHHAAAAVFAGLFVLFVVSGRRLPGIKWIGHLPVLKLCYGAAAVGLAVLTIVLPSVSFFTAAYRVQTTSFVKHAQLGLLLASRERDPRGRPASPGSNFTVSNDAAFKGSGVYDGFFFDTKSVSAAAADCDPDTNAHRELLEIFEERIPYYSESSVRLRELAHDRVPGQWRWCLDASLLTMRIEGRQRGEAFATAAAGAGLAATTPPPRLSDGAPAIYTSALPRLAGTAPYWPLSLQVVAVLVGVAVVGGLLVWVVAFVMGHVFVIDLVDPLWGSATRAPVSAGTNLLLFAPGPIAPTFLDRKNYVVLDLGAAKPDDLAAWENSCRLALDSADVWKNVLVEHAECAVVRNDLKNAALRQIEYGLSMDRSVVMLSSLPTSRLLGSGGNGNDADAEQRWTRLLSSFAVIPMPVKQKTALSLRWATSGRMSGWIEAGLRRTTLGFLEHEAQDVYISETWRRLLTESTATPLNASQLLVEADERLERHYRQQWSLCPPEQRLVLRQIAHEQLVNRKSARTVRVLMARRLVVRRPEIRLASETFRRFVLSTPSETDAAVLRSSSSVWDSVRWPFMAMLAATTAFFFATQRELFNSTLGILGGVTTGVPAVLKVISLFGEKRQT